MSPDRPRWPRLLLPALLLAGGAAFAADYQAAVEHFRSGEFELAAQEFRALVDASPAYDFGHYMLGLCSLQRQSVDAAIKSLRTAVDLNGERFEYRLGLARALLRNRQFTEARDALNRAERLVSLETEYDFFAHRGFAHAALKDWRAAVGDLQQADRARPDQAPVVARLGASHFYLREYALAVPLLRRACKLDPDDATSYRVLAEALVRDPAPHGPARQSAFTEALDAAEGYLARRPDDPEAIYLLGRAALGAGQPTRAAESFERFLTERPANCFAWVNLSRARIALENWNGSVESLNRAVDCDADLLPARMTLGLVHRLRGELEQALAVYEAAQTHSPSPAVQAAIELVRRNIEVRDHNRGVDLEEDRVRRLQEQIDEEFERLRDNVEKWNVLTHDD